MAIHLLHGFLCLIHPFLKYSLNAKSWCYTDWSEGRSSLINDMGIITFSAVDGAEKSLRNKAFFFHLFILVMNKICRNAHLAFTDSLRNYRSKRLSVLRLVLRAWHPSNCCNSAELLKLFPVMGGITKSK